MMEFFFCGDFGESIASIDLFLNGDKSPLCDEARSASTRILIPLLFNLSALKLCFEVLRSSSNLPGSEMLRSSTLIRSDRSVAKDLRSSGF